MQPAKTSHIPLSNNGHPRKIAKLLLTVIAGILLVSGLYLLLLVLSPNIPIINPVHEIDAKQLPAPQENTIYIPKIGVAVPLESDGAEALNEGAWHRFPERGDPEQGGNFIVSAHRFEIGLTPGQTARKSPFYNIGKLAVGDQVLVDFNKQRYAYEITEHNQVKPNQTEIESPLSADQSPRLTLYTCTLKGESDGREVFIGKFLGKVTNGAVEQN